MPRSTAPASRCLPGDRGGSRVRRGAPDILARLDAGIGAAMVAKSPAAGCALVARVNAETQRDCKLPDVAEKPKMLKLEAWISTPQEPARHLATDSITWAQVVKDSGARAD